ncbi:zinc finger protein OZF-like [Chrysoperla carnea]|uniref:zinc finger protein OZF-like n=1 Tax=Chrysoperla carnea TaxID=189513 RepID=UPI001D08DD18|nr:zinc finger protein OZF-like [Chrysoperla carnea]
MSACLQCRLCAEWKVGNELLNIKHDKAIQLKLESKIQQCLNLNFDNLQLPNNVCLLCCDKVGSTYDFQELVKKAQQSILEAIAEKKVNLKTELTDTENDSYQYVETVLNDYDDDIEVKEEVKDEENSEVNDAENDTDVKEEEQNEKKSDENSSPRKKRSKKVQVLDPEIAKRKAKRSALIQRTKDAWKNYKWKCATCVIECPSVENLRKHFTDEHKQKPVYSCTECGKTYDVFTTFKKHVKKHRNKYSFKCEICSRYFNQPYLLKNHMRSCHSNDRNYTCPKCGKTYKTSDYLQKHLKFHEPDLKPQFECEICNKKLSSKASLTYHQKLHLGEKDFSCEQCGKTYFNICSLQYHIATVHSEAKPFSCEQCQKTFKTKRILECHIRVHSDEKQYACEVCGKRFLRKEALTQHSTVHTGVLPFQCQYCSKKFRTKPLLTNHIRQHTGERPYSCLECNHHFANSSNYIKHMRGKHGVMSTRKNAISKLDSPPV